MFSVFLSRDTKNKLEKFLVLSIDTSYFCFCQKSQIGKLAFIYCFNFFYCTKLFKTSVKFQIFFLRECKTCSASWCFICKLHTIIKLFFYLMILEWNQTLFKGGVKLFEQLKYGGQMQRGVEGVRVICFEINLRSVALRLARRMINGWVLTKVK